MAQRRTSVPAGATIRERQDPVGVVVKNGRTLAGIETDSPESDVPLTEGAKAALSAIGAWAHMDWDETLAELERIRRESKPSPPSDDLFDDL